MQSINDSANLNSNCELNTKIKNKLNWIRQNNPSLYEEIMTAPSEDVRNYHLLGYVHIDFYDDLESYKIGNNVPKSVQAQRNILGKLSIKDLKWLINHVHNMEKEKIQKLIDYKQNINK